MSIDGGFHKWGSTANKNGWFRMDNPKIKWMIRGDPPMTLKTSKIGHLNFCGEKHHNLFGGLEHVLFFHILGLIIPTDFHIFERG